MHCSPIIYLFASLILARGLVLLPLSSNPSFSSSIANAPRPSASLARNDSNTAGSSRPTLPYVAKNSRPYGRSVIPEVTKPDPLTRRDDGSPTTPPNMSPTPAPTGISSPLITVHIANEKDFALLMPKKPGELISDAESDGATYCTAVGGRSNCANTLPQGFIRAAAVTLAPDNSYIQITGCLDTTKSTLSLSDDGGQFDVRFPNGAQCTFGGYGASFIELVEPRANRFCLRCCSAANDQVHCNSHQDKAGCPVAIPGIYDFPEDGVSCG